MFTPLALVAWILVGWCGTPWPRPWPWPPGPTDGPRPSPWLTKLIGVIGGVAGGFLFSAMFALDVASPADLVVTFFGAWAGSVVLNDAYGLVGRGQAG